MDRAAWDPVSGPGGRREPSHPEGGAAAPILIHVVEDFDAFYLREFSRLVALVLVLSGERSAAEDTAQEAMLRAYRQWDRLNQRGDPGPWVRRTACNLAVSTFRRGAAEARAVRRLASRPAAVAELPESDDAFWAAVRRLPKRQAHAVALRYVLDCSIAEVAAILGCAEGTAKATLHQARANLAKRLGVTEGAEQ